MLNAALEEPCQRKDPFFILELAVAQQTTYGTTIVFWLLAFSQWIKVHLPNILAFTTCFYWKVNEYYLYIADNTTAYTAWQRMADTVKVRSHSYISVCSLCCFSFC